MTSLQIVRAAGIIPASTADAPPGAGGGGGYSTAGRLDGPLRGSREEVIEPGDALYMPPGHVPSAQAGTEFVMFSPQDELAVSEAAMRANMERMMRSGGPSSSDGN